MPRTTSPRRRHAGDRRGAAEGTTGAPHIISSVAGGANAPKIRVSRRARFPAGRRRPRDCCPNSTANGAGTYLFRSVPTATRGAAAFTVEAHNPSPRSPRAVRRSGNGYNTRRWVHRRQDALSMVRRAGLALRDHAAARGRPLSTTIQYGLPRSSPRWLIRDSGATATRTFTLRWDEMSPSSSRRTLGMWTLSRPTPGSLTDGANTPVQVLVSRVGQQSAGAFTSVP